MSPRLGRVGAVVTAGGVVLVALAAVTAPGRLWANVLLVGQMTLGVGLGAAFLVALSHASGAGWITAIRRVPEALTALILPGGLATLAVVFLHPSTWPWVGGARGADPAAWFREAWLDLSFFRLRSVAYLAVWLVATAWMLAPSRRQDREGGVELTHATRRRAAAFLVVFALTVFLASVDWLMSLEPHWYSTVFPVAQFAGMFLSGLAATVVACVALAASGPLRRVLRGEHLHDLGKLLFAFSTFWMYIWFCQFMLIWYANLPEEVIYYLPRVRPWWLPLFLLDVAANWAIPFLVLLPREAKRRAPVLRTVALMLLAGRWLDLYLHVLAPLLGERPALGPAEAGTVLLGAVAALAVFRRALGARPPVPRRDPLLAESLAYHA